MAELETVTTAADALKRYEPRFWAKVDKRQPDDCWPWLAQRRSHGYGGFRMGRIQLAHVASVLLSGREIPHGMSIDHVCRNRICVNPRHLRVVSPRQNTLENSSGLAARNAAKTHCVHGHELVGHNLILRGSRRDCRACLNRRVSRYHKAKALADGLVDCLGRAPAPPLATNS